MNIVIPLRKTYAQIHKRPLTNFEGIPIENVGEEFFPSKELANLLSSNRELLDIFSNGLFLKSSDVFNFLRNKKFINEDDVITIIEPSLRDVYWKNKFLLNMDDIELLETNIKQPLPLYKNILDYEYVSEYKPKYDIYHQYGDMTKFNVLHITVRDFIKSINDNRSLVFELKDIKITITLEYEPYDFYDYKSESVKQFIPLPDLLIPM